MPERPPTVARAAEHSRPAERLAHQKAQEGDLLDKGDMAVSRFTSSLAAAGAVLCILSGAPAAFAEPAGTAAACAKADLELMQKLADEHGTSTAAPARLHSASMKMIDARAACRAGDYANGLVLYSDAEALTVAQSSAAMR